MALMPPCGDVCPSAVSSRALQEVEMQIMEHFKAAKDVRGMVAEMFFEMHFDADLMRGIGPSWKNKVATHADSLEFMHALRRDGLRIHYWP
jgi:hypothetical protein